MPSATLVLPDTPQGCLEKRAELVKQAREEANQRKEKNGNDQLNAADIEVINRMMADAELCRVEHERLITNSASSSTLLALDGMERSLDQPANSRLTLPGNFNNTTMSSTAGHSRLNWTNGWECTRVSRQNRTLNLGGQYFNEDWRFGVNHYLAGHSNDILGPDGSVLRSANLTPQNRTPQNRAKNAITIQTADDERAGYFVISEQMAAGILKTVDDDVFLQSRATVIQVRNAKSLGLRRRTAKADSFNWGSELSDATDNLEQSLKYGKRSMTPHYLTGSFRLSRDLVRMADVDVESMVIGELMIDFREFIEDAYLNGTGVARPLGVLVNDAEGITTSRDISYGTTSTTFNFNTLIKAKWKLKPKYRRNAVWLFHPDRIVDIAMIRSDSGAGAGTGQYLWQPSRQVGEPDVLLGVPVGESYFMPSSTGSGAYFGMIADFSWYYVAMGLDMEMQRLNEMRARTNEYEYLFRMKVDAMPMMEEAFVRLAYV